MKKVVNKSDVAHMWANQTQSEARNAGGNFYFDGKDIFSYGRHFLIARHVTNATGQTAVLFTERGYSNTTSKHLQATRSACNHLNVISVPDPADHYTQNFAAWLAQIVYISKSLPTARKPENYLNAIATIATKAKKYADFFGYKIPADLKKAMDITDSAKYIGLAKKRADIAQKEQAKKDKIVADNLAKELAKWREGEGDNRLYNRTGWDYLRLNTDKQRIETSQGVQIPVEAGKRFWALIIRTIDKGGCTNCEAKILDWSVKQIHKDFIQVGCHKIAFTELKTMATLLGVA